MSEQDPKPTPEWVKRERLGINDQLRQVIEATQKVTEAELAQLRRKLEKLTRGS